MLRELRIRDLALIAEAKFSLDSGFVVISGETGAGKSLLISAVDLLTGKKSDAAMVRQGAEAAEVVGIFDLTKPGGHRLVEQMLGTVPAPQTIEIRRRIPATGGKSTATLNGSPVSLKSLQTLSSVLIDHIGQNQTRGLSEPSTRIAMLDRYGGLESLTDRYRESRDRYETARRRRLEAESTTAAASAEMERLRFDLEELDRLSPVPGEPQELMAEAKRLSKADEIRRLTSSAHHAISESEPAVHDQLARIARKLLPIASLSADLSRAHASLSQVLNDLDDIAATLSDAGEAAQADPGRSDAIEKRLSEYRRFARRFSVTEDELSNVRNRLHERLDSLEGKSHEKIDDAVLRTLLAECHRWAEEVVQGRKSAAVRLSTAIRARLHRLGMECAELTIHVEPAMWPENSTTWPSAPDCPGQVQFLFRPNPGEPESPLERIASGGELSRLMLACMSCLADSAGTSTIILDEIDSGVGGRLGTEIGSSIADLARHHQVICITHLPQIASQADQHLLVRKRTVAGRTTTSVLELESRESRVEELAAMLRGKKADATTRAEAAALLEHAQAADAPKTRSGKPLNGIKRVRSNR
ncbi:DNA repair protein RecN [bacterium]|nr:DNA repair protein RecN [bacterium]